MVTSEDPSGRSPLAIAFGFASRITSVCLNLVIPTVIGYWADKKLGTGHLLMFCGLFFGMAIFVWQLCSLVKSLEEQPHDLDQ